MTERIRALQMNDDNRRWWALGAMCFALFMIMLDNTVVNVALPSIQRSLNASTASLEWTVNAYTLSFAVLLVTGGRLGDLFGRRKLFLTGVIIFAGSSAAIGFSPSDTWLVAWRAVQGCRRGADDARDALDHHQRLPRRGARQGDRHLGRRLGARTRDRARPRRIPGRERQLAVDLLPQPPRRRRGGLRDALRRPRVARRNRRADRRLPGRGHADDRPRAPSCSRSSRATPGTGARPARSSLFAIAVLGLGASRSIETRRRVPMVDFTFFRSRTFLGANIVAFIVSFAMLAMFFFLALYMQDIRGYSPLQAGVRFLPSTLMIVLIAPIAGRLADRVGPRPLMTFGLLCVSGSLFWQSHLTVSSAYSALLPGFVLMGIGMAFVMSPMSTAAMNSVEHAKAGVASGILSMSRMVGGTFGVAVLGALVATLGRSKLDELLPAVPASTRAADRQGARLRQPPLTAERRRRSSTPPTSPSSTRCRTACASDRPSPFLGRPDRLVAGRPRQGPRRRRPESARGGCAGRRDP